MEQPRGGGIGFGGMDPESLARTMPLADLVRRARVASDESVERVMLRPLPKGAPGKLHVMFMLELAGHHLVTLDAETGEELSRR
jgi:hypothetical protein